MWGIFQFLFLTPSQGTSELFLWCVFSLAVAHIEESYLGVRSPFLLFLQPQMVSRDSPLLPSRQAYVYYLSGMSGWTTHVPWGGELAAGQGHTDPPRPPLAAVLGQRVEWQLRALQEVLLRLLHPLGPWRHTEFSLVFSTDGNTGSDSRDGLSEVVSSVRADRVDTPRIFPLRAGNVEGRHFNHVTINLCSGPGKVLILHYAHDLI